MRLSFRWPPQSQNELSLRSKLKGWMETDPLRPEHMRMVDSSAADHHNASVSKQASCLLAESVERRLLAVLMAWLPKLTVYSLPNLNQTWLAAVTKFEGSNLSLHPHRTPPDQRAPGYSITPGGVNVGWLCYVLTFPQREAGNCVIYQSSQSFLEMSVYFARCKVIALDIVPPAACPLLQRNTRKTLKGKISTKQTLKREGVEQ